MEYYPLKELGFDEKYIITEHGEIIDTHKSELLKPNKRNNYKLLTLKGNIEYTSLKKLYRKAFNKEYARDNIKSLNGEKWKEIDQ